jgi:hypothetical protein
MQQKTKNKIQQKQKISKLQAQAKHQAPSP